jgi:hypothetical protein
MRFLGPTVIVIHDVAGLLGDADEIFCVTHLGPIRLHTHTHAHSRTRGKTRANSKKELDKLVGFKDTGSGKPFKLHPHDTH